MNNQIYNKIYNSTCLLVIYNDGVKYFMENEFPFFKETRSEKSMNDMEVFYTLFLEEIDFPTKTLAMGVSFMKKATYERADLVKKIQQILPIIERCNKANKILSKAFSPYYSTQWMYDYVINNYPNFHDVVNTDSFPNELAEKDIRSVIK